MFFALSAFLQENDALRLLAERLDPPRLGVDHVKAGLSAHFDQNKSIIVFGGFYGVRVLQQITADRNPLTDKGQQRLNTIRTGRGNSCR